MWGLFNGQRLEDSSKMPPDSCCFRSTFLQALTLAGLYLHKTKVASAAHSLSYGTCLRLRPVNTPFAWTWWRVVAEEYQIKDGA